LFKDSSSRDFFQRIPALVTRRNGNPDTLRRFVDWFGTCLKKTKATP